MNRIPREELCTVFDENNDPHFFSLLSGESEHFYVKVGQAIM
jgi:hypothetical protein